MTAPRAEGRIAVRFVPVFGFPVAGRLFAVTRRLATVLPRAAVFFRTVRVFEARLADFFAFALVAVLARRFPVDLEVLRREPIFVVARLATRLMRRSGIA